MFGGRAGIRQIWVNNIFTRCSPASDPTRSTSILSSLSTIWRINFDFVRLCLNVENLRDWGDRAAGVSAQQSFNPMRRRPETDLIRLFDGSTPGKMNGGDMETEMEGDVELAFIDEDVGKKAA